MKDLSTHLIMGSKNQVSQVQDSKTAVSVLPILNQSILIEQFNQKNKNNNLKMLLYINNLYTKLDNLKTLKYSQQNH